MTNLEITVEAFHGLLTQACLSALFAIVAVFVVAKIFKSTRAAFSGLWRKSRKGLATVVFLSFTMLLWGDKNNLLWQIIHLGNFGDRPPPLDVAHEINNRVWVDGRRVDQ